MKNENHWTKEETELFKAFLQLKNETEVAHFCRDLMTIKEIKEFSKRWKTAKLLNTGEMSYIEIADEVKTSTATVTRTNQWLKYGMNGYKTVLNRIKNYE